MEWNDLLVQETQKDYYKNLQQFLKEEYENNTVYPPSELVMNALDITPLESVKVVILGQDPYHESGQAMGLSFSVPKTTAIPRSLQNIYKELQNEFGYPIPNHGDLTYWAKQGVLLLNSVLTVRSGFAGSHAGHGWETYTDAIIQAIETRNQPVVYLLWGKYAKSKEYLITNPNHKVLKTTHPSPFSANYGFLGCGHFKICNEYLTNCGLTPIDWQIKNI